MWGDVLDYIREHRDGKVIDIPHDLRNAEIIIPQGRRYTYCLADHAMFDELEEGLDEMHDYFVEKFGNEWRHEKDRVRIEFKREFKSLFKDLCCEWEKKGYELLYPDDSVIEEYANDVELYFYADGEEYVE